jgi:tetratricopeptide (TPR) repeat protein
MNVTKTAFILCCLLGLPIHTTHAADAHTVKGVVITPDGTVVPEFSVVVKRLTDKPALIPRRHFKHGEFAIPNLNGGKYQILISAPQFITTRTIAELKPESPPTDYSIIVLHPYRNEARLSPGAAYTVSAKILQQKVPDAAREAYLKGVALHREGQLEQALIEYGAALRAYPRYLEALTDLGSVFLLFNRPDSALLFLRRAEEVDDGNAIINLNIAVALTEQGDYGGAHKMVKKVLQSDPHMANAHLLNAQIRYLQKKYDEAAEHVRAALESNPRMLDALLLMIDISTKLQNYGDAREALGRLREAIGSRMVSEFIDEQLSALGS